MWGLDQTDFRPIAHPQPHGLRQREVAPDVGPGAQDARLEAASEELDPSAGSTIEFSTSAPVISTPWPIEV